MHRARRVIGVVALAVVVAACASTAGPVADRADQQPSSATGNAAPTVVTDTDAGASGQPPSTAAGNAPAPSSAGTPSVPSPAGTPPGSSTPPSSAGPGSDPDGIGDELFPALGNPGLDVQHYDVDLTYGHQDQSVKATVGIDVRLTEDRRQITLDSDGPRIDAVRVDGQDATFTQDGVELRIDLPEPLTAGTETHVEVDYHFTGDESSDETGLPVGWFNTDGGSYVLNEPDGARTWLPSNDHPSDKATYTFTLNVDPGVTAVANGELVEHTTTESGETWVWREDQPMATYLTQLLTGDYELIDGTGPDGLPLTSAVLRSDVARMQPLVDDIPVQISFFEQFFGPFPLDRYGIAVSDSNPGLAMETQGRSLFSRDDLTGDPDSQVDSVLLSHELAHQWFGDAVSPARWQDVWLNESFATYGEWMYGEHIGGRSVEDQARSALAQRPPGVTADPTLGEMFGFDVYQGGAVALQALRLTIGDDAFFELLREWAARNDGTSRTTQDFIALAEQISGQDLTELFDEWIFAERTPAAFPTPAATTGTAVTTTVP